MVRPKKFPLLQMKKSQIGEPSLTLIENSGDGKTEAEVFELSEINKDIETTVNENKQKIEIVPEETEVSEDKREQKE